MSLNLLDLPTAVLEEIFMNLQKDRKWNFCKLTECCKFLKELIENSPRLMRRVNLKLSKGGYKDTKTIAQYRENLKAVIASSRKYTKIRVSVLNLSKFCDIENEDLHFKALFDKHASTIQKFEIEIHDANLNLILKTFGFLENMENLKEFQLEIDDKALELSAYSDPVVFGGNHFNKLEKLQIRSRTGVGPSFLKLFQHCRKLESLHLHFESFEVDKMFPVLKNNCGTLTDFSFGAYLYDFNQLVNGLKAVGLNLKSFRHKFDHLTEENFLALLEYLETQKKLKYLELNGNTNLKSLIKFHEFIKHLESLTQLSLILDFLDALPVEEYSWQAWDISKIEYLHLETALGANESNSLVEKIFQFPSNSLTSLCVDGMDFQGNVFETMVKNCYALQELYVSFLCDGLKSNDIFVILKHLKQLTKLQFTFPEGSPIDSILFYGNEDLVLPNIKNVNFNFNEYISSGVLFNLAKCIKNTSEIVIYPIVIYPIVDGDEHIDLNLILNRDYKINLIHLLREFTNLKSLYYDGLKGETFEKSFLDIIETNLKNYNKNPALFEFNYRTIEEWKIAADN